MLYFEQNFNTIALICTVHCLYLKSREKANWLIAYLTRIKEMTAEKIGFFERATTLLPTHCTNTLSINIAIIE